MLLTELHMAAVRLKALAQTIARHPWSSLQDGLLLAMAMIVAMLLALEYDLFSFSALTTHADTINADLLAFLKA